MYLDSPVFRTYETMESRKLSRKRNQIYVDKFMNQEIKFSRENKINLRENPDTETIRKPDAR